MVAPRHLTYRMALNGYGRKRRKSLLCRKHHKGMESTLDVWPEARDGTRKGLTYSARGSEFPPMGQWEPLWPAHRECARLPRSQLVSPGCGDCPSSPWRGFGSFSLSRRQGSLRTESRRTWIKTNAKGEILRKTETRFKWTWSQNKTRVLALLSPALASLRCVGSAVGQPFSLWHRLQQLQAHIRPA